MSFVTDFHEKIKAALDSVSVLEVEKALRMLWAVYERDGVTYVFGNGGSWAMAEHFSSDFNKTVISKVRKFFKDQSGGKISFNMIRLPITASELTAWGNDSGYEDVFVEPLRNHLRDPDLIIAVSSSGNSPNIVKAVEFARSRGVPVIGLSGFDGGQLNCLADAKILVSTPRGAYSIVESVHSEILHLMTQYFMDCFAAVLSGEPT